MRILGLDLGSKTIGIAISDKLGFIASTYKTIFFEEGNSLTSLEELKEIIKKEEVSKIVLGFPKNMNNSIGPRAEESIKFKKILEDELNIEVILEDERWTTVQANRVLIDANVSRKKRKTKVDKLAATYILQSYLDKNRKED
ncbi:MAG: Holliday junction resolvase RuvX [Bacilli bacterium]|jgi:putative Holliday junction resolvase|nr:Holliday junction resolvase RuvX [Mollicutes bacterium]